MSHALRGTHRFKIRIANAAVHQSRSPESGDLAEAGLALSARNSIFCEILAN
jgi:hypothetical protein